MTTPTPAPAPAPEESFEQRWQRLAAEVGKTNDADVIIYSGEIEDATADTMIGLAKQQNRRPNVYLLLTTRGGSPDAAFRMARCLKRYYKKFTLFIYGMCKSAGTLVAIGANEIVLSDYGEFGPLDVQLGKKDELFENMSGLNVTQALNSLNTRTLDFFRDALVDLRSGSKGQLSTKLASEVASKLAIGAYEKIYSQIDPVQLGAIERAIQIAADYGTRLKSANVRTGAIDKLVSGYSSHNFVIDLEEAKTLFVQVRAPNKTEEELGNAIEFVLRDQADKPFTQKMNPPEEKANETGKPQQGTEGAQEGGAKDHAPADAQSEPAARTPKIVK